VTPTISAGLSGHYEFQEPDFGRNFSIGRGRALGTFAIGRDGTLLAEAGADFFTRENDSTEVEPGILASYTHRFLAFAITAHYEQGYRNSSEDVDDNGVTYTRSAGIFLTSLLFRQLTATVGFRYEENDFQTLSVGVTPGTTDRTYSVDVGLRYLLVRSLFLAAGYTGTFRTSTDEGAEFNENRFHLGVTYEYNLF